MANVYKYGPTDWEITFDNSADINMADVVHFSHPSGGGKAYPNGVCLKQIQIYGVDGDVIGVRDGADGPLIAIFKDSGYGTSKTINSLQTDGSKRYRHPYIDTADCVVASTMKVLIEFEE